MTKDEIYFNSAIKKIMAHFNHNIVEATVWLNTNNPHLGNFTPMEMIDQGHAASLHKYVENNSKGRK